LAEQKTYGKRYENSNFMQELTGYQIDYYKQQKPYFFDFCQNTFRVDKGFWICLRVWII